MKNFFSYTSDKAGLPPGSLVYVGDSAPADTAISCFEYDRHGSVEKQNLTPQECFAASKQKKICWFNVVGLNQTETIREIGDLFGISQLVMEDILNTHQRPKIETCEDHIFLVVKMLYRSPSGNDIIAEQVSIILGKSFVISFQEAEEDVFSYIRDRIRTAGGRIRNMGADYLAYCLIDAIVDNYFVVLEDIEENIDQVQDAVLDNPQPRILRRIHQVRQDVVSLRRFLGPMRELTGTIDRSEMNLISSDTRPFFRDVYEHVIRTNDTVETFREMTSSALEIYLSSMSNKMNEVMRILTIISTFFIPLTFIAGIYGMNFANMPELRHPLGYPFVLGFMALISLFMAVFFKRKKWI